jgi:iron-sulfur cluster insertion protein
MSSPQEYIPQPLLITDSAANKIRSLVEEEENPQLKLRVFVTGGGCSGFQYGFTFDEAVAEDDAVIQYEGIGVIMDAMSYPYLVGSQVDYEEGLQGSRFLVKNPNASSTCGCGASFSV